MKNSTNKSNKICENIIIDSSYSQNESNKIINPNVEKLDKISAKKIEASFNNKTNSCIYVVNNFNFTFKVELNTNKEKNSQEFFEEFEDIMNKSSLIGNEEVISLEEKIKDYQKKIRNDDFKHRNIFKLFKNDLINNDKKEGKIILYNQAYFLGKLKNSSKETKLKYRKLHEEEEKRIKKLNLTQFKIKKPKKRIATYQYFIKDNYHKFRNKYPNYSHKDIIRLLAEEFKSLSKNDIEKYQKMSDEDRMRYYTEFEKYNAQRIKLIKLEEKKEKINKESLYLKKEKENQLKKNSKKTNSFQ